MKLSARAGQLTAALLMSTAMTPAVFAQAETPQTDEGDVIIVTAQRREQSITDVPISVTAVSGAEIEARGVEQLRDLQYSVPGLAVNDRGPGTTQIQLRGVSQFVGSPTIGTYLNEISIAPASTGAALSPQFIDIARVEVLRGPQPSLYGESSMGGTIRYITATPELDTVTGHLGAEIASTRDGDQTYRVEGVANLPFAPGIAALRLAGSYEDAGGWIDTARGADANSSSASHLRGTFLFQPNDRLSITLLGLTQSTEEDDSSLALADGTNPAPGRAPSSDDFTIGSLLVEYDLPFGTLTSSTGRIDRDLSLAIDQSAFYIGFALAPPPFGLGLNPGDITEAVVYTDSEFSRFSQEFRFVSDFAGPFNFLVGANYIDDESTGLSFSVTGPTPVTALPFDLFGTPLSTNTSQVWTIYGEADYDLTERLTATLGARYFEDERTTQPAPGAPVRSATFDSFNPRFTLSYDLGEGMLFGTIAKGFRSGGFNNPNVPPGTPLPPPNFGPESLWTYEVGFRRFLADNRLLIEAALYYNSWSDIQQQSAPINGVPVRFTVNGGEATGFGFDFAFRFRATDELTLSGTFGWNGTEYDTASATHQPGDPLDLVPEYTLSFAADYQRPLSNGMTAFGRFDVGYTAGSQTTLRNFAGTGFPTFSIVDERTLVNGRAGLEIGDFDVFLFAENILDDDAILYPAVGTISTPARPRPRTIGLGVRFDY
jgi:outer membrane receptor protein involved in Fe transport